MTETTELKSLRKKAKVLLSRDKPRLGDVKDGWVATLYEHSRAEFWRAAFHWLLESEDRFLLGQLPMAEQIEVENIITAVRAKEKTVD